MKLGRTVVNAMVVAALGFGAAGLGTGVASAKPGHGNDIDRPCFPFCENRHDDWNDWQGFNDFDRGHSDKGPLVGQQPPRLVGRPARTSTVGLGPTAGVPVDRRPAAAVQLLGLRREPGVGRRLPPVGHLAVRPLDSDLRDRLQLRGRFDDRLDPLQGLAHIARVAPRA